MQIKKRAEDNLESRLNRHVTPVKLNVKAKGKVGKLAAQMFIHRV